MMTNMKENNDGRQKVIATFGSSYMYVLTFVRYGD